MYDSDDDALITDDEIQVLEDWLDVPSNVIMHLPLAILTRFALRTARVEKEKALTRRRK